MRGNKSLKWALALSIALCITMGAFAGSIKTWSSGETLTASDLNATFQHIHNAMVGGHGARLVNADVSTSAAISHSKMATPSLLPKAWASVMAPCTCAAPCNCTIGASSGVTSIAHTALGVYTMTLSSARANANFGVFISVIDGTAGGAGTPICSGSGSPTTTTVDFECYRNDAAAALDAAFSIMIMDDDN